MSSTSARRCAIGDGLLAIFGSQLKPCWKRSEPTSPDPRERIEEKSPQSVQGSKRHKSEPILPMISTALESVSSLRCAYLWVDLAFVCPSNFCTVYNSAPL